MIFLGLDPGRSGGLAALSDAGEVIYATKFPPTHSDLWHQLVDLAHHHDEKAVGCIEKVHAMPRQGVSSTFKFGASYGFLQGLLTALEIPRLEVTPSQWQRELKCLTKGDKTVSRARAQELWPQHKWTHATADAALIAEWARRTWTGPGR